MAPVDVDDLDVDLITDLWHLSSTDGVGYWRWDEGSDVLDADEGTRNGQ